jgi:hypothetical protein
MENSNFLVRSSAALTFKLEIDFWLAQVAQTLIGMIAFLVYMRQSFAFRLILLSIVRGRATESGGGGRRPLCPWPQLKMGPKATKAL